MSNNSAGAFYLISKGEVDAINNRLSSLEETNRSLQTVLMSLNKNLRDKDDVFLSQPEACKFLGVSKPTLLEYRKKGLIPFIEIGSRVKFKKTDLLAFYESQNRRSA